MTIKQTDSTMAAATAALARSGTTEGALAETLVSLHEQRGNVRAARTEARETERLAFEKQLDEMRDASAWNLGASIASGAGQMASGALEIGSVADADAANAAKGGAFEGAQVGGNTSGYLAASSKLTGTAAELQGAVLRHIADGDERDAESAKFDAKTVSDAASDHREVEAELRALSEKASSHVDAIAKARIEALLAAAR